MQEPIKTYDFDIVEIMKRGWYESAGVRSLFFAGFALYVLAGLAYQTVMEIFFPSSAQQPDIVNNTVVTLLSFPVLMPLMVGLMTAALRHVRGETVTFGDFFAYYAQTGVISLASLVIYLMTTLGFLLLILPGIYLSVAYTFTFLLMFDKGMTIWDAMELSRKAVSKHWFKIFALMLLIGAALLGGFLTFGVGLYWAAPLAFVTLYGLLYETMFGSHSSH